MKIEVTINGDTQKITLTPEDNRDRSINRLVFDGYMGGDISANLVGEGSLVFTFTPKK